MQGIGHVVLDAVEAHLGHIDVGMDTDTADRNQGTDLYGGLDIQLVSGVLGDLQDIYIVRPLRRGCKSQRKLRLEIGQHLLICIRGVSLSKPSPTLVTNPAMPATDLCHPTLDRPLSVEEYKAIQEFPDDWSILGPISEQYKQIGNAVPIKLGEAIGKAILDDMNRIVHTPIEGFKYSRYIDTDEKSWEKNARALYEKLKEERTTEQLSLFV